VRPRARLAILAPLCALGVLAGCARALREPPPVAVLAGSGLQGEPEDVPQLLATAEALFARRDLPSVRRAVATWLAAARADAGRSDGLAGAARGGAWLAEHEPDPRARQEAATAAVQASQHCQRVDPRSASCSYWLGASLGLQARERPSTGLSALPKIVEAFERAASADPKLEKAGPDRALALLFVRAPGWPTGPGDPDRGLEHARRSVEIEPAYPPNHLALGEALKAVEDHGASRDAYEKALALALSGSDSGDPDAPEWVREAREALRTLSGE